MPSLRSASVPTLVLILGIVFSRTDPRVGWLPDSVKQMHFFTDNRFHYDGDGTKNGRKGTSIPPMNKWSNQPSGLYKDYDRMAVSAFTRGCEWKDQCGSHYKREWVLDQIFFNLVNCDDSKKQLYIDTFDVVPTALADWTPETGLIDTGKSALKTRCTLCLVKHYSQICFSIFTVNLELQVHC